MLCSTVSAPKQLSNTDWLRILRNFLFIFFAAAFNVYSLKIRKENR